MHQTFSAKLDGAMFGVNALVPFRVAFHVGTKIYPIQCEHNLSLRVIIRLKIYEHTVGLVG